MTSKVTTIFLVSLLIVCFASEGLLAKRLPKDQKNYPIALSIDEYENSFQSKIQNNHTAVMPTEGTVIATTDFDFATAYYGRSIAVGSDGVVHAAWSRTGDPTNEAMYARSTNQGKTWSTPIEVHDGYYGYKPSLAVSPANPLLVYVAYVGYQNSGEIRSIRISKSTDGGLTFGASIPVYGSAANCNNPDIAVDQSGNVHVAFDSYADNFSRYNLSMDGGATYLAEPEIVNLGSDAAEFGASVTVDRNGSAHVLFGGDGSDGSWGDKNVYWNTRDMIIGLWQQIPPVQVSDTDTGTPYATMVFDSDNVGHAFYDAAGTTAQREVQYRTLENGTWSDPTIFTSDTDGGSTFMPSVAIDQYDNLYVCYLDAHQSGTDLTHCYGDIFTGTNISGAWQSINFTGTGTVNGYRHPGCAAVVVDSLLHVLYTGGPAGGPYTIEHIVGYPWPPEPTIGITSLSDTYNPTGPFSISATTADLDGFVTKAELFVSKNGVQVQAIEMTQTSKDHYEATFSLDAQPGDAITYYGKATDNADLIKNSLPVEFLVLEPVQKKADLLLIHQDARIDTFFTHIFEKLGYVCEFWDFDAHNGIDASVTNYGWSTIIVNGWVVNAVPTRGYEDNPFAAFLQSGTTDNPKNLVMASQDYFYGNGEAGSPTELTFQAGDFAYDFFQIGSGISDPDQAANDSVIVGADPTDPIAGNFVDTPILMNPTLAQSMYDVTSNPNYIDWLGATGQGEEIFFAANQGYCVGIKYDAGTYKTVNLPWNVDMVLDSVKIDTTWYGTPAPAAITLTQNILQWFGTDKGEASGVEKPAGRTPIAYTLDQNYPNPFNPETSIRFNLAKAGKVDIAIYNAVGQRIRTLVSNSYAAGSHVAVWDGLDDSGQHSASGVYFYTLKANGFSKTMKMLMIK